MTDSFWSGEESLLAEAVAVLRRAEPVPAAVTSAARTAFGWRSVVAAVADLEFDSAVDDDDLARVRAGVAERRLRFRAPSGTAELTVIDAGRRLAGRFDPVIAGAVLLRHPGRADVTRPIDALGQFYFEELPRGAVSIRAVPSDPEVPGFQTEWVTV
ncbi:MAG TPA: hypothetical protein VG435_06865 [Acidimicrobiales bacterium]|jgi:hypothetical protein|nr:hypothetical protein [Acidimicrobiales bacterium]